MNQPIEVFLAQVVDLKDAIPYEIDRFIDGLGTWAPVIVQTQQEKDYLAAYALMRGKDTKDWICVDGIHKSKVEMPPTWVRIPHL